MLKYLTTYLGAGLAFAAMDVAWGTVVTAVGATAGLLVRRWAAKTYAQALFARADKS